MTRQVWRHTSIWLGSCSSRCGCADGLTHSWFRTKSLLMPLFLMGCFPLDFQEVKRPPRTKSEKCPTKVGKRPINEGKRPTTAMVLVGISVGCLMGCFLAPPPWRKTVPLKRPIKRSMTEARAEWEDGENAHVFTCS